MNYVSKKSLSLTSIYQKWERKMGRENDIGVQKQGLCWLVEQPPTHIC
jgi:hypothetical protein